MHAYLYHSANSLTLLTLCVAILAYSIVCSFAPLPFAIAIIPDSLMKLSAKSRLASRLHVVIISPKLVSTITTQKRTQHTHSSHEFVAPVTASVHLRMLTYEADTVCTESTEYSGVFNAYSRFWASIILTARIYAVMTHIQFSKLLIARKRIDKTRRTTSGQSISAHTW